MKVRLWTTIKVLLEPAAGGRVITLCGEMAMVLPANSHSKGTLPLPAANRK